MKENKDTTPFRQRRIYSSTTRNILGKTRVSWQQWLVDTLEIAPLFNAIFHTKESPHDSSITNKMPYAKEVRVSWTERKFDFKALMKITFYLYCLL